MSCPCENDTFCEGLPGAIPQNQTTARHRGIFFRYDSFRKGTTPLPMMKKGHQDSSGAVFSGPYLKKSSTGLGRDPRFEGFTMPVGFPLCALKLPYHVRLGSSCHLKSDTLCCGNQSHNLSESHGITAFAACSQAIQVQ